VASWKDTLPSVSPADLEGAREDARTMAASQQTLHRHRLQTGATVEVTRIMCPDPDEETSCWRPGWFVYWTSRGHMPWPDDAHPNVFVRCEQGSSRLQVWFFIGDPRGCERFLQETWGLVVSLGKPPN
jgi:hypothetical protein